MILGTSNSLPQKIIVPHRGPASQSFAPGPGAVGRRQEAVSRRRPANTADCLLPPGHYLVTGHRVCYPRSSMIAAKPEEKIPSAQPAGGQDRGAEPRLNSSLKVAISSSFMLRMAGAMTGF